TGVGSAVFRDGRLTPHLELSQHPIRKGKTYDEYIGNEARRAHRAKKWSRRVLRAVRTVYSLLHYDRLYLGGGNATSVPATCRRTSGLRPTRPVSPAAYVCGATMSGRLRASALPQRSDATNCVSRRRGDCRIRRRPGRAGSGTSLP